MVKKKLIKIKKINSKIIEGEFGNGKYFGYGKKKIISLVKFETNSKFFGYGESLVGIYSPNLFKVNVDYLSKFFLNKTIDDAIKEIQVVQNNKFFFYQGLIKSILSSFEIALLSLKSKVESCSLSDTINKVFFNKKLSKKKNIDVYSSAGSIKSSIKDLKEDIKKSKKLGIERIKIRLDISKDFSKKINLLEKNVNFYAIDLICNTFLKNRNKKNLRKFLKYINSKKIMWLEEALNLDDINNVSLLNRYNNIPYSYGENFTSYFDYINILKLPYINYLNVDITHCTISDLKKIIEYIKKEKINKKIILHCWGSIINLYTSLEVASLFKKYIYMVEFPITKFSLNDFFIRKVLIKKSKLKLQNYLEEIENKYNSLNFVTKSEKNRFSFD